MDFTLACDIMVDLEGSIRPAMYLAGELAEMGYRVSIVSPFMSDVVEERLRVKGITPINLRASLTAKNLGLSMVWLETWAREAFLKLNSRRINDSLAVVNFSHVISIPSFVWYLQGPPSVALRDMEEEFSAGFRFAYNFLKPFIECADGRLVGRMGRFSAFVVANSKFCASMYSRFGVEVDAVIYPPIDCREFRPSTSNPSSDYVLTYFGKETKFSVVKRMADMGIKFKAFGSKIPLFQKELAGYPNIEFLGRISTSGLVEAYSNALFTVFPFTHEPFGYVPLESMACGTPVLTYNRQGPSEYIIDGCTGWLVKTDDELVQRARELWREGYPSLVRVKCREEASRFDRKFYLEKWHKILFEELGRVKLSYNRV